jgi:hypothetical protein
MQLCIVIIMMIPLRNPSTTPPNAIIAKPVAVVG